MPGQKKTPIITLTTDFGQLDGYVGTMKGVMLSICPEAGLIDLSHAIPPQDVAAAAFVLYQTFSYYPPHAVHCVVVDPGVGSKRRAIAVQTDRGYFVGPDNGVFSLALTLGQLNVIEAVTLTNPDFQLATVSATFHGRDIFAPAAAHLAAGAPLRRFGPPAINLVKLDYVAEMQRGACRIIHIDHFGNLILSFTRQRLHNPEQVTFRLKGRTIKSLSYTFADVAEGELLAYVGSSHDHLEIAVRNGNAARRLGAQVGDIVEIMED